MSKGSEQYQPEQGRGMARRSFLKGATGLAAGVAGAALLPPVAAAAMPADTTTRMVNRSVPTIRAMPKVLRSSRALGVTTTTNAPLPITQNGTTYQMAQETRWLDAEHFAIGRWDGSMSLFQFETAQYVGPLMVKAANDPAMQGVEMLTPLPGNAIATSNDPSTIALWQAPGGDWTKLKLVNTVSYDPSLGYASAGAFVGAGGTKTLVVGHINGFLSLWNYAPSTRTLTFLRSVNVQNPNPTNPFSDHTMEDVVVADAAGSVVAAGSEDGYVTMMHVPSGTILSQTVFNPIAQRGINALSIQGNRLLVANCSVGQADYNLWYYSINKSTWAITLLDKRNLVIDTSLPQVFNFDVVWGRNAGAPCWFASTEEGTLWMGDLNGNSLNPIGYEQLTGPLGSALDYQDGKLVMVAYDIYQFSTAP
ncbi:MAG: hypothetical protein ACR2N4_00650 [Jatrophihabitans sp.]